MQFIFTPVHMLSVSLQMKRLVTVRRWFFISYTMIPLAQTPKTHSPITGLFSLPTRWNRIPYSGNCWAIWEIHICFYMHSILNSLQCASIIKWCLWAGAFVVWIPLGTLFQPLQAVSGHVLHVVLATPPWHWAGPASRASSWTHNALAGSNSYHTARKKTHKRTKCAAVTHTKRRCWYLRWTFLFVPSVPLACNHQTPPAEQEQPETSLSPHYSRACLPRDPSAAVSSTDGESVCA